MECRAYGICLDSQSRGYLGKDRKVSSAAGGNLSRMHKTQETAKESRLNFMYSHLRNRTLETHHGVGAVRQTNNGFQIFRPVRPPPELPREIRRCDPLGARLQPLVPVKKACPILRRLPDSLRFRPRSTKYPPRCYRRRYAPNRGERLLFAGRVQNSDALIVQKDPKPSVPLQQDHPRSGRESRHATRRWLVPAFH